MDIEALQFRAACIQAARDYFISHNYLELDTPALAAALIPETCLEVFKTEYVLPFSDTPQAAIPRFLVPSPEVFIKPVIAQHKCSVFQLSKCYRNGESTGRIHSPEFTMLEYYTMDADYRDSIGITEDFFRSVVSAVGSLALADSHSCSCFSQGFLCFTMDEAFMQYAGFSLAIADTSEKLAVQAQRLGLGDAALYREWAWDDLYELILVHTIEPALPKDRAVALIDYPARVPCLAKEQRLSISGPFGDSITWTTKERWEVYVGGVELANCYTEERDSKKIYDYFSAENAIKQQCAKVPHPAVNGFESVCAAMPPCSGVAMGFDRFIMLLAGKRSLDPFMYSLE